MAISGGYPTGLPRMGSTVTSTPRIVFRGGPVFEDYPGGKIISSISRDWGNTGDLDTLRPGLLMGKITSGGEYAPSVLGVTSGATAAGATTVSVSAAAAVEIERRVGATGTLTIVGPPSANGVVAVETLTYSAVNTSTGDLTVTATANAYVAGSLVGPTDGSQDPVTVIPDGTGVKVFDVDNSTAIDQPFAPFPVGGFIEGSQLLPTTVTDTSIQTWIMDTMNSAGAGRFGFSWAF
jgi:hypothetical protein